MEYLKLSVLLLISESIASLASMYHPLAGEEIAEMSNEANT